MTSNTLKRCFVGGVHMPLSERDRGSILQSRMTSFNREYWGKHIADRAHCRLVMEAKSPPDYRLLYDSWLWRYVLEASNRWKRDALILELLPGTSLTIPVALQSAQYQGTLYRLNDEPAVPLPEVLQFADRWIRGELTDLASGPLLYDFVIGNHVIDDLLFNLYCRDPEERKALYVDAERCRHTWESMARLGYLLVYRIQLAEVFAGLVRNMKNPSTLILRHYPSTFALVSDDLIRINAEMEAYFTIARTLTRIEQSDCFFLDVSSVNVPPGSKYPESFLVLQKGG